jgi:prefoldin subunit 5
MKTALKLIIVVAVMALIAFPFLAYMGVNSPLPFATWGQTIYSSLSGQVVAAKGTLGGLVGTTGIGLAGTAALGYAYTQIKKRLSTAVETISKQTTNIDSLSGEITSVKTELQTKASNLDALTTAHTDLNTKYTAAQQEWATKAQGYESQIQQLNGQITGLSSKAQLELQNSLPNNSVFTSADGTKQIIIPPAKKYVT